MSIFCCPICGGPLERGPSAYSCPAGHSFDLAREGYVHLLPANRMHSKMPGDDKGMAAARWAFLSKDYYAPLRDALCSIALANTGPAPSVLDTGCGEGYYTSGVYQALRRAGRSVTLAGTDISKAILRRAAKREKDAEFAVASSYHLPVADGSVDLLLNCFSPLAIEEFHRVLRPGGVLVNFDANWYAYLFDEERQQAYRRDRINTRLAGVEDHEAYAESDVMESISRGLPMGRLRRPQWDVDTLNALGFSAVRADTTVSRRLWNPEEQVNYASTPGFLICAVK